ncbi:penicillin-binding transpeptidase domain-containing protein [Anaerorudis cellulosivorans]|uniref:penicillin-binding transpeptidase domain-containing protein n=1 Tax=Anaerorudis cellulosivorans TaxID=3397862 RepID=UPI00221F8FF4|nr:penicillin-binding transpeptidase domain-containing protein [Seramator thermalis]MCW1735689.1 penicillin-binding transpeptidase domain-containing protein [Seramator thermalis]
MEYNSKTTYAKRKYIIAFIAAAVVVVYILQLFYLQILSPEYREFADSNAFLRKTLYPARGSIYDRNGNLLVYNQPTYDVMMVVREMNKFDTLDFCNTLNIDKATYLKLEADMKDRRKNPGYSSYTPQLFMSQLTVEQYGLLQEKLYKFPGIYVQNRTRRQYKYPNMGVILGYIAEVDKNVLDADPYYVRGDYIGKSGIESSHEADLRGEKGVEIWLRDARGRLQGRYKDGAEDKAPVSGRDLTLSIDIDLQAYGEYLMQNKIGSIVMIEPQTGEIVCIVSSPSYDPALLTGKDFGSNYLSLERDPYKPLINRAVAGMYPPGSTFKPSQGAVFMKEGIITADTRYSCFHGYPPLGGHPACHSHASPLSVVPALATSCNSFFCYGLNAMLSNREKYADVNAAFDVWRNYLGKMGYGDRLGVDLPSEKKGFIPNSKFYTKVLKRKNWNAHNIISIAIGQGEILATPLQIANFAAVAANRGYYYVPHVVRERKGTALDTLYTRKHDSGISPSVFEIIVQGMANAVTGGTCRVANLLPEIEVCGKTGTAQNPHGDDHSLFMGFAPKNNPRVAIAVIVENGRFGASNAVPIGRLMLQKFFNDSIPETDKWLETRIVNTTILPHIYTRELSSAKTDSLRNKNN